MRALAAAAAGGVGILAVLAAAPARPEQAMAAWLAAMLAVTMLPAGALALLLVWHLHRGRWGATLGPALVATVETMPVAALGMLPVLLLPGLLYPWAAEGAAHAVPWLSQPGFALRGIVCLALWCLLAALAARDGALSETAPVRPALASVGLVAYALTASFIAIDWVLSLQPEVFSSIVGLIFMAHQTLGAFAFLLLVGLPAGRRAEAEEHGLGAMLFGGLMLWLYLEYMQYLVVWSGDLPGHIELYLARTGGIWTALLWLVAVAGGALPFLLLLWRRVRGSARALRGLGLLFLACRVLEAAWWVLPLARPGPALALLWAASLVGAGGFWVAAWLWRLERRRCGALGREAAAHG